MQTAGDIIIASAPLPAPLSRPISPRRCLRPRPLTFAPLWVSPAPIWTPSLRPSPGTSIPNRHAPDHGNRDQAKTDQPPGCPCRDLGHSDRKRERRCAPRPRRRRGDRQPARQTFRPRVGGPVFSKGSREAALAPGLPRLRRYQARITRHGRLQRQPHGVTRDAT